MTREECEMLILQHVKEIRDITKQYDTSKKFFENGEIIRDDN